MYLQVNIVKHLQTFPGDTIGQAIGNVISFDSMDPDVMQLLRETFQTHGVSIEASTQVLNIVILMSLLTIHV